MKTQILKHRFLYIIILLVISITFFGCSSDDDEIDYSGLYQGDIAVTSVYPSGRGTDTSNIINKLVEVKKGVNGYYVNMGDGIDLINGKGSLSHTADSNEYSIPFTGRTEEIKISIVDNNMTFLYKSIFYIGEPVAQVWEESGTLTKR